MRGRCLLCKESLRADELKLWEGYCYTCESKIRRIQWEQQARFWERVRKAFPFITLGSVAVILLWVSGL